MPLTRVSAPAYVALENQGYQQRENELATRRLNNRKAMLEIENELEAQGRPIGSIEDYMQLVQSTLGPSVFINSTAPTVDAAQIFLEKQNAAAKAAQEKARIEAFNVAEAERKSIEQTIKERFANGEDPISVLDQVNQVYGVDMVQQRKPDFKRLQAQAEHEGMAKGIQIGSTMLRDMDDFTEYKQSNPHVPKFEIAGMQKAAEANEAKRIADIQRIASEVGKTGPINQEAASFEIRSRILPLFGAGTPTEKVERNVQEAVKIALAESARQSVAANQRLVDQSRLNFSNNLVNREADIFKMEQQEYAQRELAAEQRKVAGQQMLSNQIKAVEAAFGSKTLNSDEKALKQELVTTLSAKAFIGEDASLYIDAVMSGDTKRAEKIKARAIPMAQAQEQYEATARIISGAHRFKDPEEAVATLTTLGMSKSDITKIGIEISKNMSAGAELLNKKHVDTPWYPGSWSGATSGKDASTSVADEAKRSGQIAAANLTDGFKSYTAEFVQDALMALRRNGSVAVSPEQQALMAQRIVSERVDALVSGMRLSENESKATRERITKEILDTIPAPLPIDRKESQSEVMRRVLMKQGKALGMDDGVVPRAPQPYPGSGQSNNWAPADF